MSTPTHFHAFSRLPAELRVMIWQQFSFPEKAFVHIVDHLPRTSHQFKVTTYPRITSTQIREIAAVASVSREARREVLKGREIAYYENSIEFAVYYDNGPYEPESETHIPIFCVSWETDLVYITRVPYHSDPLQSLRYFIGSCLQRARNLAFNIMACLRDITYDTTIQRDLESLLHYPELRQDLPEIRQLFYVLPREMVELGFFSLSDPLDDGSMVWYGMHQGNLERVPEVQNQWGFYQLDEDWVAAITTHPVCGQGYLCLGELMMGALKPFFAIAEYQREAGIAISTVIDHLDIKGFDQSWMHWAESNPEDRDPLHVLCLQPNDAYF
ncbi:hypothetical protein F4782DRAFT_528157 [Xylaria castorea]|nr:hypothetical protein F4782DRAFT_528157 [Xylaria castorea]